MIHKGDEDPNWFYVHEGRREGPLDRRELIQALLARDAPEKTLVWRSGLSHWMRAGELQELRLELPPPIPKDAVPRERTDGAEPPPVPADAEKAGASPEEPEGEDEEDDEEDELATPAGGAPEGSEAGEGGRRRRRRRKRKHTEPAYNPRVLQLAALFLMLALVVWLLLRRMNQFPEGTVIDHGRLDPAPIATELPRCASSDRTLGAFDRPPASRL